MSNVITETTASGLRIVSEHLSHVHTAAFALAVNVGARHELQEENGISHFLEHMAFKGTSRMNAKQIAETFDSMGGNINAYTSHEHTVYYVKVLKEYAADAARLLCEIVRDSQFDAEEMDKEREVILQEIAMHNDNPDDLVFDIFQENIFKNLALGRSILGTPELVSNFKRDDLLNYTAKHYNAKRMVLSAAGNVEHKLLQEIAAEFFADNAGNDSSANLEKTDYVGGRILHFKDLEQVQLLLGLPAVSSNHDDYYKLQIFSTILGGGMSSRLFQEVRENLGLAYHVSSYVVGYQDCGTIGIYGATTPENAEKMFAAIIKTMRTMRQNIGAEELLRAKNQMKSGIVMSRENVGNIAEWMARHTHIYGRVRTAEEIIEKINAITADDIKQITEKYLQLDKLTVAALGAVKLLDLGEFGVIKADE